MRPQSSRPRIDFLAAGSPACGRTRLLEPRDRLRAFCNHCGSPAPIRAAAAPPLALRGPARRHSVFAAHKNNRFSREIARWARRRSRKLS
jgi:hypothetical protein